VSDISHEYSADLISDFSKELPIDLARVCGSARDDQLRSVLFRERSNLIWIDQTI
jgi:hypothetical protein